MTHERKTDELRRLANAMAEDVLATSDEEMLLQLEGEGTAAMVAATAQADLAAVKAKLGHRRLLAAKQALAAEQLLSRPRHRLDAPEARTRLAAAVVRSGGSAQRLTFAARDGENVPDEDLEGLIQDAEDLGIDLGQETEN